MRLWSLGPPDPRRTSMPCASKLPERLDGGGGYAWRRGVWGNADEHLNRPAIGPTTRRARKIIDHIDNPKPRYRVVLSGGRN
jgi:hypothetical protein